MSLSWYMLRMTVSAFGVHASLGLNVGMRCIFHHVNTIEWAFVGAERAETDWNVENWTSKACPFSSHSFHFSPSLRTKLGSFSRRISLLSNPEGGERSCVCGSDCLRSRDRHVVFQIQKRTRITCKNSGENSKYEIVTECQAQGGRKPSLMFRPNRPRLHRLPIIVTVWLGIARLVWLSPRIGRWLGCCEWEGMRAPASPCLPFRV
jgi:hypothetical protein